MNGGNSDLQLNTPAWSCNWVEHHVDSRRAAYVSMCVDWVKGRTYKLSHPY